MRRERERDGGLRRRERREGRRHDAVITTVVKARAPPRTTDALGPNAPDASAMAASDGTAVREHREERAYTSLVDMPGARRPSSRQPLHQERLRRRVMEEDERDEQPELAPGRGDASARRGRLASLPHRTSTLAVVVVVTRASEPEASCVSCVGAAGRMPPLRPPDPRPELCEEGGER